VRVVRVANFKETEDEFEDEDEDDDDGNDCEGEPPASARRDGPGIF
jgi:hypothetical protein